MTKTSTPIRYFWFLLAVFLSACAPTMTSLTSVTDLQNTAIALARTSISLTQTAWPTASPTVSPIIPTPSQIPTLAPPPIFTPDVIQVERWREYQTALARSILPLWPLESLLCEWDILARAGQEVYVWAVCGSSIGDDSRPAVIHLETDGSVSNVEVPERGSPSDIDRLFPKEVQSKFSFYTGNSIFNGRLKVMYDHLAYRETHPEEPPLVILSATPTATPTP